MKCKHENTRKLFWSNNNPNRWERTNVSICLDCDLIVGKQVIKLVEKDKVPSLTERTNNALSKSKFRSRKE